MYTKFCHTQPNNQFIEIFMKTMFNPVELQAQSVAGRNSAYVGLMNYKVLHRPRKVAN